MNPPTSEYYIGFIKEIDENRKLRDQFIGTLMLLAYDGCISEGRARELIGLNVYEWRAELKRILEHPDFMSSTPHVEPLT